MDKIIAKQCLDKMTAKNNILKFFIIRYLLYYKINNLTEKKNETKSFTTSWLGWK